MKSTIEVVMTNESPLPNLALPALSGTATRRLVKPWFGASAVLYTFLYTFLLCSRPPALEAVDPAVADERHQLRVGVCRAVSEHR